MEMLKEAITILFSVCVLMSGIHCIGHYTILAPETIRSNSDYQVALTLHDQITPTVVKISIDDGGKYMNSQEVTLDSNNTQFLTLRLNNLNETGTYKLKAEGLSGIVFKNETTLRVQSKNVSIFLFIDKAIYKPAETIKFRVLILDSELRPAELTKQNQFSVFIVDPQGNRIKQWKHLQTKKGVFSSELKLSELPILGDWVINVEVDDEKKSKMIEVAEYVLPKFEVTIDSPKQFSAKDDKIRAIVRAKYTYGKFVKGEAIVSIQENSYSHKSYALIRTIKVDGKGTVEFDVETDLKPEFQKYYSSLDYKIEAIVIEELTGRNQSVTKEITLNKSKYKVVTVNEVREFNAGLPVKFDLTVMHHDDSSVPINDATKSIVVGKIRDRHTKEETVEYFKFSLNSTGSAQVKIPTISKEPSFYLTAKYMDEETDLGYYYPKTYSEPNELEIKVLTKK